MAYLLRAPRAGPAQPRPSSLASCSQTEAGVPTTVHTGGGNWVRAVAVWLGCSQTQPFAPALKTPSTAGRGLLDKAKQVTMIHFLLFQMQQNGEQFCPVAGLETGTPDF